VGHRILRTLPIALLAVVALAPAAAAAQGGDTDCPDYPSQAAAQAVLRAVPSDPDELDGDNDGIACESSPAPRDLRPVTATGVVGGTDDLPFTGPSTLLPLAVAAGLLALGGAILWTTRYRSRHAR
jgi:Excalibur calcium-binding domain